MRNVKLWIASGAVAGMAGATTAPLAAACLSRKSCSVPNAGFPARLSFPPSLPQVNHPCIQTVATTTLYRASDR
ncbi:hypothetical protein KCP76_23275 [Salmonella enterica subsp. enterica serovar Weltevreden]|nr:hypothetical protein KCP76_23275 [Salmonella enterica subsp. enterica serovar Weltevreden]